MGVGGRQVEGLVNPATGFWQGRRVLVTGHTGFKGSWLCLLLSSFGAKVWGYALDPPTQPSLYSLARVHELIESTIGDVRNLEAIVAAVRSFAPEFVFHMAAQSVVLHSYEDPVETYSTNVLGTVNVLEAIRRMRQRCIVINVTGLGNSPAQARESAYAAADRITFEGKQLRRDIAERAVAKVEA